MINWQNLINSGSSFPENDTYKYRINFINVLILIEAPLFLLYSFVNFKQGYFFFSIADMINVFALIFALIYMRRTKNINLPINIIILSMFPIFFIAFFYGGVLNTAFYWFFMYPINVIFLKGRKKATKWLIGLFVVIFGFYLYAVISELLLPYNPRLLLILMVAISIQSLVLYYYDGIRRLYDKIIIRQNTALNSYKNELEERVNEKVFENKKLSDEIIATQKEIIYTLSSIGESRSQETGHHVKRVAEYSYVLAKLYGLDEEGALLIKQAAPMHDIGKIAIPDDILNKPGVLTPEEFELMKEHTTLGYEMLKHSNRELLKTAATIALYHHEKYDGTGYPLALRQENIPLCARITALADVFDALGSHRVYKKPWDNEKIFEYLIAQKGHHFDPKLVNYFFDHIDKFLAIKEKLKDE